MPALGKNKRSRSAWATEARPVFGNPKLVKLLKPLLKTKRNVSEVSQQKRLSKGKGKN